jgi:hypothetical protein
MSKVALSGNASGTGTFTIASPNGNTDRTLTLPDNTGTILTTATAGVPVNGPAFAATPTTGQSVSASTWTKVVYGTEAFDTNSNYDTSLSRFTPTVAGYYQISGTIYISAGVLGAIAAVYKNGSISLIGTDIRSVSTGYTTVYGSQVTDLVYMNGSTDYVEIYTFMSAATLASGATGLTCKFSGFLARSAT